MLNADIKPKFLKNATVTIDKEKQKDVDKNGERDRERERERERERPWCNKDTRQKREKYVAKVNIF